MPKDNLRNNDISSAEIPASMRYDFEKSALGMATKFGYSFEEVREAYQSSPESLTAAYNGMSKAKSEAKSWVGWSVVWAVLFLPAAAYTGYRAYNEHQTLNNFRQQVDRKVTESNLIRNQDKMRPS